MKVREIKYVQEMHCCGPSDTEATATMSLQDGGGGEYLVLDAIQWSFDEPAEIDKFAAELKRVLATASE